MVGGIEGIGSGPNCNSDWVHVSRRARVRSFSNGNRCTYTHEDGVFWVLRRALTPPSPGVPGEGELRLG